jgi:hypothetical protein
MRDAFGSLRTYVRKLYACSTIEAMLSLAQETAAAYFPEASYLTTASRQPDGGWIYHGEAIAKASRVADFASHVEDIITPIFTSDPLAADIVACFPEASLPGDIATFDMYDEVQLKRILGVAFGAFKRIHEPMLAAAIQSRGGLVAKIYLGDFRKSYDDEIDLALVSAIADFASLAASP